MYIMSNISVLAIIKLNIISNINTLLSNIIVLGILFISIYRDLYLMGINYNFNNPKIYILLGYIF